MQFLVIEGLDGSGKSTQLKLLMEHLDGKGRKYRYLHFPRLEEGIYGKLIARFLRGEMGTNETVDPYLVALIFAGDRADAAPVIRRWMEDGFLVIVDRYVYSNIAFQCAKVGEQEEQERLRDWILELEFGHNRLPRPDINLFLNVPFDFIRSRLADTRRGTDRDYLRGERDIHEADLAFQEQVRQRYLSLHDYVGDLRLIECADATGAMRPPGEISNRIVEQIEML